MAKSLKKILTQEDIQRLREGDLVKISGYGRMMYHGKEGEDHVFLGRCRSRSTITEIRAREECLHPEGNPAGHGNLMVIETYNESTYHPSFENCYQEKNLALRNKGGI